MGKQIREVYIIHHSHTDVGYTDLQEQIIYNQVNNIRNVVSIIKRGYETGSQEKDLNLIIAGKLKDLLEQQDLYVLMTREEDEGLYDEGASNKKVQDMKRRCELINGEQPAGVISIHQNSYPDPSVCGVQVFYYKDSVKSKAAAEIMQTQLVKSLKPSKERAAKDNSSYYLLKKTSVPIMIVECAFMSNPTEADLLIKDDYQEKVAWAIYMGIMQVINSDSP